jgi:CheY-like chemotaxis protein
MINKPYLNSWKEISEHVGRSVRTVQRWERQFGFPVHRPAGKQRSAVVALPAEIDTWIKKMPVLFTCDPIEQIGGRWSMIQSTQPRKDSLLCIDDYEEGLVLRKAFLEAMGYHVLASSDGKTGVELFQRNKIDLVVLDYKMEIMDGEAVARLLRQRKPRVPILMLSGEVREIPHHVAHLVDDFVHKSEPTDVLLHRIQRLLRKGTRALPPPKPMAQAPRPFSMGPARTRTHS